MYVLPPLQLLFLGTCYQREDCDRPISETLLIGTDTDAPMLGFSQSRISSSVFVNRSRSLKL